MKRKKHPTRITISEIEYLPKDLDAMTAFMERYKTIRVHCKKPNIRFSKIKEYFANLDRWADEMLIFMQGRVQGVHIEQIKQRFKKYYSIKKYYGEFLTYPRATEKKLDELMRSALIYDCGKIYKMRTRLENPECVTIAPFLTDADAYFEYGIERIIKISSYIHELNIIDAAVNRRITRSGMRAPFKRMFYIHVGKTNSGKTYTSLQLLKNAKRGAYLSPLRLLALEVCDSLNSDGVPCSLLTGEEEMIIDGAEHIASTVELADYYTEYDVAVIDECQMISDYSRGHAWTRAITDMRAREICLCTAPEAVEILVKLIDSCGDYYEIINHRRKTPLVAEDKSFTMDDVQSGDALVAFSKQKVNAIGAQLIKQGISVSVLYGALPYTVRKQQFENFISGKSTVLVTTDAIGMGVNLPVRRIIFMEAYKFDGRVNRLLTASEVKQIAGRAGRRGRFDTGYVSAVGKRELDFIKKRLAAKNERSEGICVNFPKKILEEKSISLKSAVKAWEFYDVPDYYIKESLKQTEKNTQSINKLYNKLHIEKNKTDIYEMASMPIDVRSHGIKELWLEYVEQRLTGAQELRKPYLKFKSVDEFLNFSKMLDTYYLCSKSWGMSIDFDWLERKRAKCNKALIAGLISDVETHTRECISCGKTLEWNNKGDYCEDCQNSSEMLP